MDEIHTSTLSWSACPARLHPKKAVFAWGLILVVGVLMATINVMIGIGAVLMFLATQATFLFPSTFSIDEAGVHAKYPIRRKHIQWARVRRVMFGKEGCALFTRKKSSTLDAFTGVLLLYGANREAVESAVKKYMTPGAARVSSNTGVAG